MVSMMESLSMRLSPLLQQHNNFTDNNATASNDTTYAANFPPGIMDTLLTTAGSVSPLTQLLLFVYKLLGSQFGIDPSLLLTAAGLVWAVSKLCKQVYFYLDAVIERFLVCSMHVSEDDRIYEYVMRFLAKHSSIKSNRHLTAQTVYRSAWDDDYDEEDDEGGRALFLTNGGDDEGSDNKYLNFSNQAAAAAPRYIPAMGTTNFWHKGTYFKVNRFKESLSSSRGWNGPVKELEAVQIACYGRSIAPVKGLLSDAKALYYQDMSQKTTIYRPRCKDQRRDYNMWQQVARRPIRPISTVVLDSKEKHAVLADINEYLHPATPRWYASRGIPLRRGYLFHGPPGTGKTSFSFALAGVFGIDIHVASLQDGSIAEEDLNGLLTNLPRRSIILLEDVDSAGLHREGAGADGEDKNKDDEDKDNEVDKDKDRKKEASSDGDSSSSEEEVKSKKKRSRRGDEAPPKRGSRKGISLSGLLNAIDGVASHEGRVLIMTTNKPESLDAALIRPGRVDVQVAFTHASPFQMAQLFQRMYEPPCAAETKKTKQKKQSDVVPEQASLAYQVDIEAGEMKTLAAEFARHIPQGKFSPAEVQGFLLKRKKSPRKALAEVQAWVEASLKQKEAKSKVVTVQ